MSAQVILSINCKRLMDVTDEELQSFGYNDEP